MATKTSKPMAKTKILTDAAIINNMKTTAPWLYQMYTSPAFTPDQQKVFIGWARKAAAGITVTDKEKAAATYNWDISQIWSTNQQEKFQESFDKPGQYKAELATAQTAIDNLIKQKGLTVDQATRDKAVNETFMQGMSLDDPRVLNLLTSQGTVDATPTGESGVASNSFATIAAQYGIPLPKDPKALDAFIKGAIGPNGSPQDFTEYAKTQAKAQYPWMAAQIDQGVIPSHYFQPYATNIGNTLDIAPDSINWQDPKWSSLLTKTDASGAKVAANFSDVIKTIKTDPQYRYDYTPQAKTDAYNLGTSIGQMFGKVA